MVGAGTEVIVTGADVALQPLAFVTVTLYAPPVETPIDCVVAPLDQRYDAPAEARSAVVAPGQIVVEPSGEIVAEGVADTGTLTLAVEVVQLPSAGTATTV